MPALLEVSHPLFVYQSPFCSIFFIVNVNSAAGFFTPSMVPVIVLFTISGFSDSPVSLLSDNPLFFFHKY